MKIYVVLAGEGLFYGAFTDRIKAQSLAYDKEGWVEETFLDEPFDQQ